RNSNSRRERHKRVPGKSLRRVPSSRPKLFLRCGGSRRRRKVRLPVVHSLIECFHLYGNRVNLPIVGGRRKRETVFVANQLGNLRVSAVKIPRTLREIDAPAGNASKFAQRLVGGGKTLLQQGAILLFLPITNHVLYV